MIEATCSACGTLNRIAEADVPAGAKFVNCTSCKSRVALPQKAGAPAIPKIVPQIPKIAPQIPKIVPQPPPAAGQPPPAPSGEISDLPAPRRQSALGNEPSKPAPRSGLSSALGADLPSPKAPAQSPLELDDLMGAELPAPRASQPAGISDLPAPRASQQAGISDLPAPKARPVAPAAPTATAPARQDISDLPAPKARVEARRPPPVPAGVVDLPMPKAGGGITDLPMPKAGGGITDLPMPKPGGGAGGELTPKGGRGGRGDPNADLLTPKAALDLPAPKGFFDDLPQPARSDRPEVPAPLGFFDDLPQVARNAGTNDLAPKGFFDDLPQPAKNAVGTDVAPLGFFDDLPQPAKNANTNDLAPKGFFDDLPQAARTRSDSRSIPLDLSEDGPIELASEEPIGIEIGHGGPGSFDELDLSRPTTGPNAIMNMGPAGEPDEDRAAIRFEAKRPPPGDMPGRPPERAPLPSLVKPAPTDIPLELEGATPATKVAPKRKEPPTAEQQDRAAGKQRRMKFVLAAVLGLGAVGAGGFILYQRHAAAQERADSIEEQLGIARKALSSEDPARWQHAANAATKVLELDEANAEALGIAAESSIAGAFADGKTMAARFARGRKLISDALGAGVTGPALERAQALNTLTTAPDKAVPKLAAMLAKAPKDGSLALYLGWAQAAASDPTSALKSYDQAIASTPSLKALALDGRARAKLALADVEGARADFAAILAINKDNIPAQVGIASTLPQAQAQQREADLLAILARKDIANADPRAVVQAWVLAGDDALRGRRIDAARERFRKALAVEAKDVSAMTGLAETELRDRKFEVASELITKVLTQAKDDVQAQLVAAEIEIKLGKLDIAAQRIELLESRKPPLPPLDQSRLKLITGRLLEEQNKDDAAIEAYEAAAKLAGDFDLTPTMAAVAKLSEMSHKASEARNPAREAELRERADKLLSALADKAQTDPQLALTLGVAYLQSGDPNKAEPWLRRVVEARPTDGDALYQYGKVLSLLAKFPEAIEELKKARELTPDRLEVSLELARTYERTKNDAEAGAIYDVLVKRPEVSIEIRAHAGKYFARTSQLAKAGEEGTKILAVDPEHAAGHYLKGEGLLANGRFEEARKEFSEAVTAERNAQYLDGQGRATEALALQRNKDLALQDAALRSYIAASELDPLMFSPLLGAGRLYVLRKEHAKAIGALVAAQQIREDDGEVAFLLGVAYQETENKPRAIEWLRRALSIRPTGEIAYRLGQLYTDPDINQAGPAQQSFATATRLAQEDEKKTGEAVPWLTEALYQLGNISLLLHDDPAARRAWELYVSRPGLKPGARLDEIRRHLATDLHP